MTADHRHNNDRKGSAQKDNNENGMVVGEALGVLLDNIGLDPGAGIAIGCATGAAYNHGDQ